MDTNISKEQGIQEMKELLEVMARALVDEPDRVEVKPMDTGERVVLELRVADDDMGRVIGKGGRRAQAMRSIIKAKAARVGLRSAVDIIDREEDAQAAREAKESAYDHDDAEYEESYDDSYDSEESYDSYSDDDDYDDFDDDDYDYDDDDDYDYDDEDDEEY